MNNGSQVQFYERAFTRLSEQANGKTPAWIRELRSNGMKQFHTLGFPSTQDEQWKYTNVRELRDTEFKPSLEESIPKKVIEEIERLRPCRLNWHPLVFVNGLYAKQLSQIAKLPQGVTVTSLQDAIQMKNNVLEAHLTRSKAGERDGFSALNCAFLQDGAFVSIPENVEIDEPIELVFIAHSPKEKTMIQPRNFVSIGKGSRATVVEHYVSLGNDTYFTNVITEISVECQAVLEYLRLQKESKNAFHISTTSVRVVRDARFSSGVVDLGGKLSRNNLNVALEQEGAECALNGLYLPRGKQHMDNHTAIHHAKPHGTSHQVYKGILDDEATAVFGGKIVVAQDAQKTDAHQTNKNLLLSEKATVDTKPQLEIFADDVKCTHGAAIGQLDENSVFYLKSRGVGEERARKILSYGFANEVIERVKVPSIRAELTQLIKDVILKKGVKP